MFSHVLVLDKNGRLVIKSLESAYFRFEILATKKQTSFNDCQSGIHQNCLRVEFHFKKTNKKTIKKSRKLLHKKTKPQTCLKGGKIAGRAPKSRPN